MIQQELTDVDNVNQFAEQLKDGILHTSDLPASEETELLSFIDDYVISFGEMVTLDIEVAQDFDEFQVTTQAITPLIEKFVVEEHQRASDGLSQFRGLERTTRQLNTVLVTIVLIAGVGLSFMLKREIVPRIVHLSGVAHRVVAGDKVRRVSLSGHDEIGQLAEVFNRLLDRSQNMVDGLENQVVAQSKQLGTVLDTSQKLISILDINQLLRQIVTVIKESFDYYHVHVYLLDQRHEQLIMAEGYGKPGETMKQQGHRIPFAAAKSLVSRAARENKIITVEDVRSNPHWLPNPLLPDTQSEMAIPITLGYELVGVLDVQSDEKSGLTRQDEVILQALANQIAIAVRNAHFFTDKENTLQQLNKLQNLYTGQAWEKFGATRLVSDYEFREANLPALQDIGTPEADDALFDSRTIITRLALATPLKLRDEIIGVLGIRDETAHRQWSENEIALIEAVAAQMSLAIENARLFEETGRRAAREKIIAEMTQQIWASGELELVMQTTVAQLATKLEASKVIIRLGTEDELLDAPNV
jgi:GAF domain-containing protein/HAMP domain-containing protein